LTDRNPSDRLRACFAPLADEDVDTLLDEMAEYFHEDGSV